MGNKKPKNTDKLLEKAEKLLEKGNYQAAKKEFEKANKALKSDDIAAKIILCDRGIEQEKAKDLIKKGKKSIGKKMLKEALRCFREAYEITGEDWLKEKIETLKMEVSDKDLLDNAEEAESRKDYQKAADLFKQAHENLKDNTLLLRMAHCLVPAGRHREALDIYASFSSLNGRDLYDYGFASAQTGRFYDCLQAWDKISKTGDQFRDQKKMARDAMAASMSADTDIPLESLYEQCCYLESHGYGETMSPFFEYVKRLLIKKLWKEERYPEIHELIYPWGDDVTVSQLRFYTKLYFRMAFDSPEYLDYLLMFWLTGLYNREIFSKTKTEGIEPERLFDEFVQTGENLIRRYMDSGVKDADNIFFAWSAQKALMSRIDKLMTALNEDPMLICTPQFAFRFGLAERICQIIEKNQDRFETASDYLETGAYYCSFGRGLVHLDKKEYATAFETIKTIEGGYHPEFESYCRNRIHFEYGLHCIETKTTPPHGIFEAAADLFDQAPEMETMFIDKAINAYEDEYIKYFETALKEIVDHHPSPGVKNALSYLMTVSGIKQSNKALLNLRMLETVLMKALKLNPENELAKTTLEKVKKDKEMDELVNALDRFKFNKAAKIAAETENEEVAEMFFEFLTEQYNQLEQADIEPEKRILMLNELGKWGSRADHAHPLLQDIHESLTRYQQG